MAHTRGVAFLAALGPLAGWIFGCFGGDSARPEFGSLDAGLDAGQGAPDADGGPCTQLEVPDGGIVHVTGTVAESLPDGGPGKPLANAAVAAEYGGLYLEYCDRAKASPYYVFGAVTDASGHFALDARAGVLGFHSFATGYLYSRAKLDTAAGLDVILTMEPLTTQTKPTVANAAFDKTTVAAGALVTFSAEVRAATPKDPLSDEILLIEPSRAWSAELDPPGVGKPDDFPDGTWRRSFNAPDKPGTYTYYFSATTAYCVTSDLTPFTLQVQ